MTANVEQTTSSRNFLVVSFETRSRFLVSSELLEGFQFNTAEKSLKNSDESTKVAPETLALESGCVNVSIIFISHQPHILSKIFSLFRIKFDLDVIQINSRKVWVWVWFRDEYNTHTHTLFLPTCGQEEGEWEQQARPHKFSDYGKLSVLRKNLKKVREGRLSPQTLPLVA